MVEMKIKHIKHMFLLVTLLLLILSVSAVNADNANNTTVHKTLDKQDSNVNVSTVVSENKKTDIYNGNLSNHVKNIKKDIDDVKTESSILYVSSDGDNSSDGTSTDSPTTLLNALANIENNGTIYFVTNQDDDVYTLYDEFILSPNELRYGEVTIPLSSELSRITLMGLEGKNITFTSEQNNRIFTINGGIALSMINLNFDKCGNTTEDYKGGAIYTEGELNLINCTFTNNVAGTSGGAIYSNADTLDTINQLNIENTIFKNNSVSMVNSDAFGGALYVNNAVITINNSLFESNFAYNSGAIYLGDTASKFYNSNFSNNTVDLDEGDGGAILINNTETSDVLMDNVTFEQNQAGYASTIALNSFASLNVTNSYFNNNTVNHNAMIYNNGSIININNTIFDSNKAESGALLYVTNNGQLMLSDNTIVNNTASDEASIIYNDKSVVNMTNNVIENNRGNYLLYNTENNEELTSIMELCENIIINNTASSDIIIANGVVYIDSNEFTDNVVTGSGYIINNQDSALTVINNVFVNNTDDNRDMLIGGNNPYEISNNDYIDNYLNDTLEVEVNELSVKISLKLNEIYDDFIRSGMLYVYINGEEYLTFEIGSDEYSFNIDDLGIEDSNIELKTEYISQSKHYQNISLTKDVTLPTKTTIISEILNTTWSNPQLDVTVLNNEENPLMEGNLTIKDTQTSETLFETPITNDKTSITLDAFNEVKEYNLTIEFSGTQSYRPSNTTILFNTTKEEISYEEFSFENQDSNNPIYIGEKYNFNDLLEEKYSITEGNWIISIDDQIVLNTTDCDNHQIVIPDNLTEGTHNITGNFTNDFYYANINDTFTVIKQTPRLLTNPTMITDKSQKVIEISVISDSNVNDDLITKDSNVTLLIEELDLSVRKETENGELEFSVDIPEVGVYTIIVIFEENDKYAQVQTTIPVVLNRTKTVITLNVTNATQLLTNMTATGQLTDIDSNPITGENITLYVNDNTYALTTDNQGIFTKELLITSANNDIVVEFEGNIMYQPSSNNTSFNVSKEKVEWSEFDMDNNIRVEAGTSEKIFSGRLVLERDNSIGVPNATINYYIDIYSSYYQTQLDRKYYTIITDENGYFEANQYPDIKFDHQNDSIYIYDNYYPNLVISFDGDENYYAIAETKESYITTDLKWRRGALRFHGYDTTMYNGKAYASSYIYGLEYYDYVIVSKNILSEEGIPNINVMISVTTPVGEQNMSVTTDSNGKANFHFRVTGEAIYFISAKIQTSIYSNIIARELLLLRSNGTISLNPIKGKYVVNETVNLSGKLLNSSGELIEGNTNITLKVNNKTEAIIPVNDGLFEYNYTPLTEGNYNISLEYKGDLIHHNISLSKEFNATKLNSSIKISEPSNNKKVSLGSTVNLSGQLKDSRNIYLASKEVTVKVNQDTYTVTTNELGKFTVPITIPDTGIINITVNYDGDIVYNPCNMTLKLNSSSKMKVVFDDYDENNLSETVIVGDMFILKGHVYDNVTQKLLDNVNVTLSMINYTHHTTTNQDGQFTLEIPTNAGKYNLNMLFKKEYYNTPKEVFKLIVNKKNLTLGIDTTPQDLKLADNITVTINVTDNDIPVKNQTVYVTIKDDNYTLTTDDAGIINFTVATKNVGQNLITVTSKETSQYYKNNISSTFDVDYNTVNLEVTSDSKDTRFDDNVTIYVTASDAYDNPIMNHLIRVIINEDLSYNLTTDSMGKTNVTITADSIGENNVSVIMNQSDNYLEHGNNTTFIVRKLNTALNINNTPVSIEANQNANITISVYLVDEDGTPVKNQKINLQCGTDTINDCYTDEEGVYSHKLPRQNESAVIFISAYFDETIKYLPSSNNLTLTIEVPPVEENETSSNSSNPTNSSNDTNESNTNSTNNTEDSNSTGNSTGNTNDTNTGNQTTPGTGDDVNGTTDNPSGTSGTNTGNTNGTSGGSTIPDSSSTTNGTGGGTSPSTGNGTSDNTGTSTGNQTSPSSGGGTNGTTGNPSDSSGTSPGNTNGSTSGNTNSTSGNTNGSTSGNTNSTSGQSGIPSNSSTTNTTEHGTTPNTGDSTSNVTDNTNSTSNSENSNGTSTANQTSPNTNTNTSNTDNTSNLNSTSEESNTPSNSSNTNSTSNTPTDNIRNETTPNSENTTNNVTDNSNNTSNTTNTNVTEVINNTSNSTLDVDVTETNVTDTNSTIPELPQNTNKTENSGEKEDHSTINPTDNQEDNKKDESEDTSNEEKDSKPEVEVPDEPKPQENPIDEDIPKDEPYGEKEPQNEISDNVNNVEKPETSEDNKNNQKIEDKNNHQENTIKEEISYNSQDSPDITPTDNQDKPQETTESESNEESITISSEKPLLSDSSANIDIKENTIAAVATTNKAYEMITDPIPDDIPLTWIIVMIIACGSIIYGYLRFKDN
jgi:predicted outer membrane repeat protein